MKGIPNMGYDTCNRPQDTASQGTTTAVENGYRHLAYRANADCSDERDNTGAPAMIAPGCFAPGQIRLNALAVI
jgi:hypothetical protein